jgi:tRNA splicing ligase
MMFKEELKKYVETSGLVNMKEAGEGIYVLKYKKKVFYDNLWNEYIAECRGSIVDKDFNLVAYPFTKIYNYGIEKEAPVFSEIDTIVTAFRKVNGFMVAVSYHNGDVLVSTTGSTSGDFVEMAKEMMLKHMPWADWQMALMADDCRDMTFMFECVHPNDPHIVVEKPGMYILGYREKTWQSNVGHHPAALEQLGEMFNCFVPECQYLTVRALKNLVKTVKHEGFVFYDENGVGAKIKSPYYLTSKWVARNPRTDKLVDLNKDIKQNLDEEYYPLVDAIRANIVEYTAMDEQARLAWVRNYMEAA